MIVSASESLVESGSNFVIATYADDDGDVFHFHANAADATSVDANELLDYLMASNRGRSNDDVLDGLIQEIIEASLSGESIYVITFAADDSSAQEDQISPRNPFWGHYLTVRAIFSSASDWVFWEVRNDSFVPVTANAEARLMGFGSNGFQQIGNPVFMPDTIFTRGTERRLTLSDVHFLASWSESSLTLRERGDINRTSFFSIRR